MQSFSFKDQHCAKESKRSNGQSDCQSALKTTPISEATNVLRVLRRSAACRRRASASSGQRGARELERQVLYLASIAWTSTEVASNTSNSSQATLQLLNTGLLKPFMLYFSFLEFPDNVNNFKTSSPHHAL